jgi:hypothetical protein
VTHEDAQRAVHEAVGLMLDDGEIAVHWTLTIDVAGPNDTRYLAHRAGGGIDGTDHPMVWTALGMLRASVQVAEGQLRDQTLPPDDDGED